MSARSKRSGSGRSSKASRASERSLREDAPSLEDLIVTGSVSGRDGEADQGGSSRSRVSSVRSRESTGRIMVTSAGSQRGDQGGEMTPVEAVPRAENSVIKTPAGSSRASSSGRKSKTTARSHKSESEKNIEMNEVSIEKLEEKDLSSLKDDKTSERESTQRSSRKESSRTKQKSVTSDHGDRDHLVERERERSGRESKSARGERSGRGRSSGAGSSSRPELLSENTGDLYQIDDGGDDLEVERTSLQRVSRQHVSTNWAYSEDSDFADDVTSNAAANSRDDDDDDDVAEVVVLDPEHHLMERFQARLADHLEQQRYKYVLELRELQDVVKNKKKEREDVGVELYGLQQELAKYQSWLEKLHDDYSSVQKGRQLSEQQLSATRQAQQLRVKQLNETRKTVHDLQAEDDAVNRQIFYLNENRDRHGDDIALARRAAEKSKNENKKLEVEKRMQDLYVNRLVEQLERLEQDIAMCDAQLKAQSLETKQARDALGEANLEISVIGLEKRQLFQQWLSTVVGMSRRDEAHATLVKALHDTEQRLQTINTELNAFKKSTQQEQELNEKMMGTLNKIESGIEGVRRQLATSRSEHESMKLEFSTLTKILAETEDCFSKVNQDKSKLNTQLEQLKRAIEKQYLEKVRLEDDILDKSQEKLTAVKGSQYTQKLTKKLRDRTRDLESQLVVAENDIAKIMLSTAHQKSRIDAQNKLKKELDAEVKRFDESIARAQAEISRRELIIERKQNSLDILHKRVNSMVESLGGEELNPLELSIKSLHRLIDEENQQITEQQQSWLREQAELVQLCKEREELSRELEAMKEQISVLTEKHLRIERVVEQEKKEKSEIQRQIKTHHTDRIKLDTLVQRQRGTETTLRDENILTENKYLQDLRAAEKTSIQLDGRLDGLREEKSRLLNSLVEAERQIMMWERKTELARETHQAIDADIGHGEIHQMKTEIHRMEVRLNQLTKQQEKLIVDMERSVSYRDTIATRGEAANKNLEKLGKGAPQTRNIHQRAVAALRRTIKQKNTDMAACDTELTTLRERQKNITEEIDKCQSHVKQASDWSMNTEAELDEMIDTKGRGLVELVSQQRRAKYYEQAREGRYKRVYPGSGADLGAELRKLSDRVKMVGSIAERLAEEFHDQEAELKRAVVGVYESTKMIEMI